MSLIFLIKTGFAFKPRFIGVSCDRRSSLSGRKWSSISSNQTHMSYQTWRHSNSSQDFEFLNTGVKCKL